MSDDRNDDQTLPTPSGYEWPRLVPEMPEPPEMLPLVVEGSSRHLDGLRLLVAYLLTAAPVVVIVVLSFAPSEWLGALVTAAGLVLVAAGVSVHADSVES